MQGVIIMTSDQMISVLREAREEVERQRKLVSAELLLSRKPNHKCAAWPALQAALDKLSAERNGFGT